MTDARTYLIVNGDVTVDRLRTAPTPGRSADENAVANLIDHSLHHPGRHLLVYAYGDARVPLATARAGVGTLLVPLDDVQADAMHAGPDLPAPVAEAAA
jgi:hypothetical protein